MGSMATGWRREWEDALLLGVCALVVLATWFGLGWYPADTLAGADAHVFWAPYLEEARRQGEHPPVVTTAFFGGGLLGGVMGWCWLVDVPMRAGASPLVTVELALMTLQVLVAFFGVRAAQAWAGETGRASLQAVVPTVWLVAWGPMVSIRMGQGHLNLVAGAAAVLACVAVAWSAALGAGGWLFWGLAAAVVATGMSLHGHQVLLHAAVLLGPWVLASVVARPRAARAVAEVTVVVLAAALSQWSQLSLLATHALGPDMARDVRTRLVDGYPTPGLVDLALSAVWPIHRPAVDPFLVHESVAPLGAVLWLAMGAVAGWRLRAGLGAAVAVCALWAVAWGPLVEVAAFLPAMTAFRAPIRVFVPLALMMGALAASGLMAPSAPQGGSGLEPREPALPVWVWAGALALAWLPAPVGSAALWVLVALGGLAARRSAGVRVRRGLALLASGCSVALFAHWKPALPLRSQVESVRAALDSLADDVRRAGYAQHALDRLVAAAPVPFFNVTGLQVAGVSTVQGFGIPSVQLGRLLYALHGQPFHAGNQLVQMPPDMPGFAAVAALYNVRGIVRVDSGGAASVEPVPTLGPLWFPTKSVVVADVEDMVARWNQRPPALDDLRSTAFVKRAAPALDHCGAAQGALVNVTRSSVELDTTVPDGPPCMVVLALTALHAWHVRVDGTPVEPWVVDGAVLGVMVPSGRHQVLVAPR